MSRGRIVAVCVAVALAAAAAPAAAQQLWSSPATWGGAVPGPGAHVVVPQGQRIVLDVSPPPLASLTINGVLTFARTDLALSVGWVMVHGMLEVGTDTQPFAERAVITLTGALDENVGGMGARGIVAMHGGRIELHGVRRADVDWAVLAESAQPGDTSVALALVEPNKTVLGWRPGDLLAVAPSGRDPLQAEAVTVTAVSGTRVSFWPPLRFAHAAEVGTIAGRTVDERAEVGLLTRNIVVQGASDGLARQLGGHIMIMAGGIGRIEGTELRNMGQMGRLGRYPIHWHLTGPAPIDYARFNSIWNSFHRGVVLHRTDGVEVRGNVAANVWSHTFVVGEDGTETGNVVEDNLGILTKRLPDEAFVLKRHGEPGWDTAAAQDEWRPATFWVNNPRNTVRGNRAAGGLDAIGFFYDDDHGRAAPADLAQLDFSGNVAHSYLSSLAADDPVPSLTSGLGLLVRTSGAHPPLTFGAFTAYQNTVAGAWIEPAAATLSGAVLAGNASGAVLVRGTLDDAIVTGPTANRVTAHPEVSLRGGVRVVAHERGSAPKVMRTTFIAQPIAAIDVDNGRLQPGSEVRGITLIDTPRPVYLRDRQPDHSWSGALVDADGSLTGSAGPALVTGLPLDATTVFVPGWGSFGPGGAYVTPRVLPASSVPANLTYQVERQRVLLSWQAPADGGVLGYVVEAGSAPSLADLVRADVSAATTQEFAGVPAGRFVVRVRARTAAGLSAPSNEVTIAVGGPACLLPDRPMAFTASVTSGIVTLRWTPSAGATGYVITAGAAAGAADVRVTTSGAVTRLDAAAPPGRYFVRVAAMNACGVGANSDGAVVTVP